MNFFEKFMPKQSADDEQFGSNNKQEAKENEQIKIESVHDFLGLVKTEANLAKCTEWFWEQLKNLDEKSKDHCSLPLFRAYRKADDFEEAKRYITFTHASGMRGRIDVWEKESGLKYDGEMPIDEKREVGEIIDTTSFFSKLEQGGLEDCAVWFWKNVDGKYANNSQWQDHVSLALFRAYRKISNFEEAKKYIKFSVPGAKQGRIDVWEKESGEKYEEI